MKEFHLQKKHEEVIHTSEEQNEEPNLLIDDIIVAAAVAQIDGVEDYGVEELDFIEEEPEDI